MLSQTCIIFFLVLNTEEDILKNVGNQTVAGPLTLIEGKQLLWKSLWTSHCLVTNIIQNNIYVQLKKETHSGLKLNLSE